MKSKPFPSRSMHNVHDANDEHRRQRLHDFGDRCCCALVVATTLGALLLAWHYVSPFLPLR